MRDEITLTEYNDMKDPERRERRLAAEATYPCPEPLYTCVICGKDGVPRSPAWNATTEPAGTACSTSSTAKSTGPTCSCTTSTA